MEEERAEATVRASEGGAEEQKELTAKERVITFCMGLCCVGFCAVVWMYPTLFEVDTSELSGRGGRKVGLILNLVWSRPVATIAGLLGVMAGWGAILGNKTD